MYAAIVATVVVIGISNSAISSSANNLEFHSDSWILVRARPLPIWFSLFQDPLPWCTAFGIAPVVVIFIKVI